MSEPLKISILDKTDTQEFEQLVKLLKEFTIDTFVRNKPEYANLKGREKYEIVNMAIQEFEGQSELSILTEQEIEQLKIDIESQISSAKELIENRTNGNTETRYYVMTDEDRMVSFQQVQLSRGNANGRVEGWRNLAYTVQDYRGKEGEVFDSGGQLREGACSQIIYNDIGRWFEENGVNYERTCTGVNMLQNIKAYIITMGFLPANKNDKNIFLEKNKNHTVSRTALKKAYNLYCENRNRDEKRKKSQLLKEIESISEFDELTDEQRQGLAQCFLKESEKEFEIPADKLQMLNSFIEENLRNIRNSKDYDLLHRDSEMMTNGVHISETFVKLELMRIKDQQGEIKKEDIIQMQKDYGITNGQLVFVLGRLAQSEPNNDILQSLEQVSEEKIILFNKIQEFENCVKNAMKNKNEISMEDLFIYCGSTAMNLLFLSDSIEVFGDNPINVSINSLESNTRKMHDIDIHVFNEEFYQDLERERDENGNERKDYPYKIEHDSTWFGEPKKFTDDDREYIVIDRFKDDGIEEKPQNYAVVKINDREYRIESPLNLLAYKICFSLQQARLFKYPKPYTTIDEMKLEHNSFDINALSQFAESVYPKEVIEQHILNVLNKVYEKEMDSEDSLVQLKKSFEEVYCKEGNNIPPIQSDIIKDCLSKFFGERIIIQSNTELKQNAENISYFHDQKSEFAMEQINRGKESLGFSNPIKAKKAETPIFSEREIGKATIYTTLEKKREAEGVGASDMREVEQMQVDDKKSNNSFPEGHDE